MAQIFVNLELRLVADRSQPLGKRDRVVEKRVQQDRGRADRRESSEQIVIGKQWREQRVGLRPPRTVWELRVIDVWGFADIGLEAGEQHLLRPGIGGGSPRV